MKRTIAIGSPSIGLLCGALLVLSCLGGCGGDEEVAPDLSVHFADSNFEAAVRCALGGVSGPLYPSDLTPIVSLPATDLGCPDIKGVKDLSGIQYCTNLASLTLSGNDLFDISPLRGLRRLVNLYLGDNSISDISALEGLKSLQQLELQENRIRDISPLQGLAELRGLNLKRNRIGDDAAEGEEALVLEPLRKLYNLSSLDLSENKVRDLLPLVYNCMEGGLGTGDVVILIENPLSDFAKTAEVAFLREHGVTVTLTSTP